MLVLLPVKAVSSEPSPPLQVKVAEPYVDIHTGPGRGYPVFHVVERHAPLTLLFQRAGWIKVETARGRIGWVPRKALLSTLDGSGETPELQNLGHEDLLVGTGRHRCWRENLKVSPRWRWGLATGSQKTSLPRRCLPRPVGIFPIPS